MERRRKPDRGKQYCPLRITHCPLICRGKDVERALCETMCNVKCAMGNDVSHGSEITRTWSSHLFFRDHSIRPGLPQYAHCERKG